MMQAIESVRERTKSICWMKDCSRVRRKSSHGAATERRDHDERTNGQA